MYGHPRDACVAPMGAAGKTSMFFTLWEMPARSSLLRAYSYGAAIKSLSD